MKAKTTKSRLSIYKDRFLEVQRGALKDEYKWWLFSLSLSCSSLDFFRSKWLVIVVIVINCINVCLALLLWSFGKLFGFRLTSHNLSSISISYSNRNMVLGAILPKFKIFYKKCFFISGGVEHSLLAMDFDVEKGIGV